MIGYDDLAMAGWEAFALTTVRQPLTRMAKRAVRVLLERLQSGSVGAGGAAAPAQREIFPPQLVKRETTAPPPAA